MFPKHPHATRRGLAVIALLACVLLSAGMTGQSAAAPTSNYSLAVSTQSDRSSAQSLAGKTYSQPAEIFVFVTPTTSAKRVRFYLDDTTMSSAPRNVASIAPFDFAGTASDGSAVALDVGSLSIAAHTITAAVETTNGKTRIVSASFTVTAPAGTTPPPPPPPPPTGTVDPSGEAAPTGDLPGWRQVFVDDFSQDVPLGSFPAAVSSKWSAYPNTFKDTSKNGVYWPEKTVSINGGLMDMWLHTETINGVATHLVAAPLPKLKSTDPAVTSWTGSSGTAYTAQTYGRYAVRFRADPLPQYKTAWLLWPKSGIWPGDGEIDFPEGNLNSTICAFMHRQNGTSGSDQDGACSGATYPTWHTAVIEWTPTICRFILDGKVILAPTSRIPSNPMRWVLQTETALSGGPPADSTAGHVQVDWVAAYAPA